MKNLKTIYKILFLTLLVVAFVSCDEDDDWRSTELKVDSVSFAENDSLVTTGYANNMYIIRGSGFRNIQKIYFNETDTYFNPTLVTNEVIFVTILDDTPYAGANNELVIETTTGSVSYNFPVGAPPPEITSFTPLAGGVGDIVTITGKVFDDLIAVRFGEISAEIVSSTPTEIKVKIPEGIVQSPIFVETKGGITQAQQTFGFKAIIYDDELAEGWWIGGWDGTQDFENTEQVKRGEFSIKRTYATSYSGFQIGNGNSGLNVEDYSGLKVSIYGGVGASQVSIVVNGNYDGGYMVELTEGEWTDFTIPFSELGSPTDTIKEIVIQGMNVPVDSVIYIDDIGLI